MLVGLFRFRESVFLSQPINSTGLYKTQNPIIAAGFIQQIYEI